MRKYIFTALVVFMSVSALAVNTPKLNDHQQALKERLQSKWQQKTESSAAKAKSAASMTTADDFIKEFWGFTSTEKLDSIVYKRDMVNSTKYILKHDGSNRVSQVTVQDGNYAGEWSDRYSYDLQYDGSDIVVTTNQYADGSFTPSSRATYYAGNMDNYMYESYTDGTWVKNARMLQECDDKGNITKEQLSVYTDGVEYIGYRISYSYENNILTKVEFYENNGTELALVETDVYTYGTDGKLSKITAADWYEEYKYTGSDVERTNYSMGTSSSYYKSSIYVYAQDKGDYSPYKKESYDENGKVTRGYYRVVESAEDGKVLTLTDYDYDTDSVKYILQGNKTVKFNADNSLAEITYREASGTSLDVVTRDVYSYLSDGRLKTLSTYNSIDEIQDCTVYFYTDNTDDPTGIASVQANDSQEPQVWYDLSGRRVNASYHGIVIVNGRKMIR